MEPCVDPSAVSIGRAFNDRNVALPHDSVFESGTQLTVRFGAQRENDNAAGSAVDSMDHERLAPGSCEPCLNELAQGALGLTAAWDHDQPGWLVDGEYARVLVQDAELGIRQWSVLHPSMWS